MKIREKNAIKDGSAKRVNSTKDVSKSLNALNIRNGNSQRAGEAGVPSYPHEVKPHRRLLAMSATSPAHKHIWVGMDSYKAATHKTAMNTSFRMKLPAINDVSNKHDIM